MCLCFFVPAQASGRDTQVEESSVLELLREMCTMPEVEVMVLMCEKTMWNLRRSFREPCLEMLGRKA